MDATPDTRDRYVDFLRAVSLAVVVMWHWVFSITHWTADGRRYLARLGVLRGSRRKRLLDGLWAASEGVWFDSFGPENVNYSGGQFAVPNFAVVPGGVAQVGAEFHDAISVFTAVTTHVIVDITAVQVPSIAQVNPAHLPGGAAAPNQLRAQAVRKLSKPSWYKGQS